MDTTRLKNYEKPQTESFPVAVEECFLDTNWKPIVDDGELE